MSSLFAIIKALFPDELGQRSASNLDVWTTDATGKRHLLENPKDLLADELGEDGNFEVSKEEDARSRTCEDLDYLLFRTAFILDSSLDWA